MAVIRLGLSRGSALSQSDCDTMRQFAQAHRPRPCPSQSPRGIAEKGRTRLGTQQAAYLT
jgi:hypothetical protein